MGRTEQYYSKVKIVENNLLRKDVFELIIDSPEIASKAKPGQFVMISSLTNFLPRPMSIANVSNNKLHLMIRIVGSGTRELSRLQKDDEINILGALGEGFPIFDDKRSPIILAGGMGIAPVTYLLNYLMQLGKTPILFYGENIGEDTSLADNIECTKYLASMDGTVGFKGSVIDCMMNYLNDNSDDYVIYSCGPEVIYSILAKKNIKYDTYISLEERMACGIGACMGCVVLTNDGYKRICKDGPVFEIGELYK